MLCESVSYTPYVAMEMIAHASIIRYPPPCVFDVYVAIESSISLYNLSLHFVRNSDSQR